MNNDNKINIIIPAPLGAGILLGLVRTVAHLAPVGPGRVEVIQADSTSPCEFAQALTALAVRIRPSKIALHEAAPWAVWFHRGALGSIFVTACQAVLVGGYTLNLADPWPNWADLAA